MPFQFSHAFIPPHHLVGMRIVEHQVSGKLAWQAENDISVGIIHLERLDSWRRCISWLN
jgi:hypothetical protein